MSEERNLSVADYHSHFRELQFLSSIASVLIGLLLPVFWYLQGMEFSVMGGLTLLLGLYEFWCWIAMKWNGGLSITAVIESPRKEYFLMAVLSTLLERQASQPEDKAFALNGILSRFWDRPLAKPDYAKPYGIVYKDLFLELLAWSSHCMNLLLNAGSNQADMPTWVPDWKTTDNRKWLRYENQYFHISEDQYFFSYSGGTLHVEAVIGGTVNLCCDLILPIESLQRVEESPDRSSPAPLALSKFLAAVSKDFRSRSRPEPCPNGRCSWGLCRAFCESFQYALNGISNARPAHAPQSHHTRSDEEHPRLRSQGQDIADTLQEGSAFCGVAKSTQSLDQAQSDISELNAKVSRILDGQRRLFFAGVNRIGTSVPAIRTGDKIALIKGVAIPMILRGVTGTSNRFTVVGPAFVSGFAQGPSYTGAGEFNQIELV
ncbi:hypothetical protein MMC10_003563 [Thelotrema lepadinum]|nr:hypothetical protein [Thelotrema lepadinum]